MNGGIHIFQIFNVLESWVICLFSKYVSAKGYFPHFLATT